MANEVINLEDVRLSFKGKRLRVDVLRGVDLSVGAGESLAVVGPSGSGKSSLLMIVAGLERPTGGRATILGRDLGGLDEDGLARLRRDHVGIVFQSFHLIPTMTARENVATPLDLAGRSDAFERAADELAQVGLADRTEHYPGELSGGEQQRVAIARAMASDPSLLLADEPTGNLDRSTGRAVADLLFELAGRRGATLLLVTHDPELASRAGRRIALNDGRIAA